MKTVLAAALMAVFTATAHGEMDDMVKQCMDSKKDSKSCHEDMMKKCTDNHNKEECDKMMKEAHHHHHDHMKDHEQH